MKTKPIMIVTLTVLMMTTCLRAGEIHDAAAAGDLNKVWALLKANPTWLDSKDNGGGDAFIAKFKFNKTSEVKTGCHYLQEFKLHQNYPNSFNPSTMIQYSLARQTKVDLSTYDSSGRQVTILENTDKSAGSYSLNWDGKDS